MKLKLVSVVVAVVFIVLCTATVKSQVHDANVIWLRVYGQGAVENMTFGTRVDNTFGADIDTNVYPRKYVEQEPPPPSPGFDCVWKAIRTGQFGGYRGLLDKDFRKFNAGGQRDTFRVGFSQADNSSADISMKWPDAAYLGLRCSTLVLRYTDPTNGPTNIDMFAQDSIVFPAAGDNGISQVTIYMLAPDTVDTGVRLEDPKVPTSFGLHQNYPNPFNPTTLISFDIQKASRTDVSVYNMLGQKITTLAAGELAPGSYSVQWNGTTGNGTPASSGMYFVRINAQINGTGQGYTALRKMLLLK